ncbi:uncharacterized protein LOC106647515 [Copidosoma floridanum]|uniref:uncharacterized protein LOC106647515 n=1 Tax=Copidosoma floridanum TaxID=29053 RepID=UPI0006C9AC7E|nr:uncharacterized protein LOC106647515 [Copidosoma floridanum]
MDISSMLEVEVQEVAESKENVTPRPQQTFSCQSFSSEENDFYKLTYGSDIAAVRFLRLHCTTCDEHIGSAPSEAHNMHEHPVLRVLLCAKCREFYGDGTFEQGDDATDMFCRWCANGGNLYCCSYCSNTFCSKCIKRNFDPPTIKRIEAEDTWKCFVCDPKDLYPLRSIARALILHIETVTRILENNRRMSPREVEEKMHLDETKCCSRKRKRRRRRTMSGSDDDNDDDEDVSYVPNEDRSSSPPAKKRKSRCSLVRNSCSNGFVEHDYNASNKRRPVMTKIEPDYDPSDLISQCEQSMIEGDDEIINTNDDENGTPSPEKEQVIAPGLAKYKVVLNNSQTQQTLQLQPLKKIQINNSMGTLNPVPIANLLKAVPIFPAGSKKINMTGPSRLLAMPVSTVPKSVAASSISFVKPTTHFLVPKSVAKTLKPMHLQPQLIAPANPLPLKPFQPPIPTLPKPTQQPEQPPQPSVIDLDSDDESIIVENVTNQTVTETVSADVSVVNEGNTAEENVVPERVESNSIGVENEPMIIACKDSSKITRPPTPKSLPYSKTKSTDESIPLVITIDGVIPLKTQQRYQRFEKMLKLQSQEIDNAVGELKTKILKLVQTSISRPSASQTDADLQNAAFVCTKRFHRALRKALVELSHINDRLVKDYLHWKKRTDKAEKIANVENEQEMDNQKRDDEEKEETDNIPSKKTENMTEVLLEMTCEHESASESESENNGIELTENHKISAIDIPADFSSILDHLSIFKRKPTAVKAVGNDSVLTEDKACQAYDVPWRDYEKCIGYSLLTKAEYDPEKKEEILRPVAQPDENFGKYQEQYLFYLQHVEDFGIETDETKGRPDPNHIPLKDLIESSSPFIMDMLERLSPVALSNGCRVPVLEKEDETESLSSSAFPKEIELDTACDFAMDTSSPPSENNKDMSSNSDTREELVFDKKLNETPVATSKAVEELQKMVSRMSEELRIEQLRQNPDIEEKKEIDLETETLSAINSILDVSGKSNEEEQSMDIVEILDLEAGPSNDEDDDISALN